MTNRATPCHRHRDASRGTPADRARTRMHGVLFAVANAKIKVARAKVRHNIAHMTSAHPINPFCMMMHEAHSANPPREDTHLGVETRRERCPFKSFRQHLGIYVIHVERSPCSMMIRESPIAYRFAWIIFAGEECSGKGTTKRIIRSFTFFIHDDTIVVSSFVSLFLEMFSSIHLIPMIKVKLQISLVLIILVCIMSLPRNRSERSIVYL